MKVYLIYSYTTKNYTLSLHDALPIYHFSSEQSPFRWKNSHPSHTRLFFGKCDFVQEDRKSTRLNSSHVSISYAVFCLYITNGSRVLLLLYWVLYSFLRMDFHDDFILI